MEGTVMRTSLLLALLGAVCVPMLGASPAHAQTRTWVSGVGDDLNPCSRTAPCKTFAGAISKTAAGGEIDCLDPGGFGTVTITKSITIDCNGVTGGILAAGTNGVNINAANIVVSLRNLVINGAGTGLIGINFLAGAALNMDNVTIMGFNAGTAVAVKFSPNSTNAVLEMNANNIFHNGVGATGGGVLVQPAAGGSALATLANSYVERNVAGVVANSASGTVTMSVRDSTIANNTNNGVTSLATSLVNLMIDRATISNNLGTGVLSSGASSGVRLNNSMVTGNGTGVATAAGGILKSYKNNAINGNGVEGTPIPQENLN
jgi:hypothetical protein